MLGVRRLTTANTHAHAWSATHAHAAGQTCLEVVDVVGDCVSYTQSISQTSLGLAIQHLLNSRVLISHRRQHRLVDTASGFVRCLLWWLALTTHQEVSKVNHVLTPRLPELILETVHLQQVVAEAVDLRLLRTGLCVSTEQGNGIAAELGVGALVELYLWPHIVALRQLLIETAPVNLRWGNWELNAAGLGIHGTSPYFLINVEFVLGSCRSVHDNHHGG
ncbi:hypothetical protein D3C87_1108750 [compost metagenome]